MDIAPAPSCERLHGVSAVAELKRAEQRPNKQHGCLSPRRQCRGRIEAQAVATASGFNPRRLHGVSAVAELKRAFLYLDGTADTCLHGVSAVAELKRHLAQRGNHGPGEVSTASVPWPN